MQIKPPAQLPNHAREALIATRSSRRRRRWPWALGGLAIALVAALAFALLAWPRGALRLDASGLPQVQLPRLAGSLVRVSLQGQDGVSIPVILRQDGTVWPMRRVIPGTRLFAEAVFRRPRGSAGSPDAHGRFGWSWSRPRHSSRRAGCGSRPERRYGCGSTGRCARSR